MCSVSVISTVMTAECKVGETEMVGATSCNAVLYITNVMWTALGQDTGICVVLPELLYKVNCDETKIVDISLVLNMLLNRQP